MLPIVCSMLYQFIICQVALMEDLIYVTHVMSYLLQVVHVVDTTGRYEGKEASSYISLFSTTPGKLTKEVENIGEGLVCGRDKIIDFVTFSVHYGCVAQNDMKSGWSESDIPTLHVEKDMVEDDDRTTEVIIDTKISTRWSLAINMNEIEDFRLKGIMIVAKFRNL